MGGRGSNSELMNFSLEEACSLFGVTRPWAVSRRIAYLDGELRERGDLIEELQKMLKGCGNETETALVQEMIDNAFKEYGKVEFVINSLRYGNKSGDLDGLVEKAREYPISSLLGTNRKGQVRCPFHEDKHPSAKIYPDNRLHCFTCNKQWDSIAFVMERDGLDFKGAVNWLVNGERELISALPANA